MRDWLIQWLVCPACLPEQHPLHLQVDHREGEDILQGALTCSRCSRPYSIQEGIPLLLPEDGPGTLSSKYEQEGTVSSYLWAHYGDLLGFRNGARAYGQWADLIQPTSGLGLDAGCAVGRFTFELARRCDHAVGLDRSIALIQKARTLLTQGCLEVTLTQEGMIQTRHVLQASGEWNPQKVEFVVGDAQALPLRTDVCAVASSLNLLDKIPRPLLHLQEMNRVTRKARAQMLVADPYSWSLECAPKESWLGGKEEGPFQGRGLDNVAALLTGRGGHVVPPWTLEQRGHVWWKIRNHANHYELIRSCHVKVRR